MGKTVPSVFVPLKDADTDLEMSVGKVIRGERLGCWHQELIESIAFGVRTV